MYHALERKAEKLVFGLSRKEVKGLKRFASNLNELRNVLWRAYDNYTLDEKNAVLKKYLDKIDPEMDHLHSADTEIEYKNHPRTRCFQFLIGDYNRTWNKRDSKKIQFAIHEISTTLEVVPNCNCLIQQIPSDVLKRVERTISYIVKMSSAWNKRIEEVIEGISYALAAIEFNRYKGEIEDLVFKKISDMGDLKAFEKQMSE